MPSGPNGALAGAMLQPAGPLAVTCPLWLASPQLNTSTLTVAVSPARATPPCASASSGRAARSSLVSSSTSASVTGPAPANSIR